jgi:hypothetical protein
MLVPTICLECHVLEGFIGEFHWAIHTWRLLEQARFGRAHPYFSLSVLFQRECYEALLDITIMGTLSRSMVKSAGGECHES